MRYPSVDLGNHKSDILVVRCADPRFQGAYRLAIDELDKIYDLLVAPGASLAIVKDKNLIASIKLLHDLHRFNTVYIFDHINCAAFGEVENELKAHGQMIRRAARKINTELPQLKVKALLFQKDEALPVETK